jgi:hypothetical protein
VDGADFAGKTGENLWIRTASSFFGFRFGEGIQNATSYIQNPPQLPEGMVFSYIPTPGRIWVGKERKVEVYSVESLAQFGPQGIQPPPEYTIPLSFFALGVRPVVGSPTEVVFFNNSQVLWGYHSSGLTFSTLGYYECGICLRDLVGGRINGESLLTPVSQIDSTLTLLRLSSSGIVPIGRGMIPNYTEVQVCGNDFLATRQGENTLFVEKVNLPSSPEQIFSFPLPPLYDLFCTSTTLYLATLNSEKAVVEVNSYSLPPLPGTSPLQTLLIPYADFLPPTGIQLYRYGNILAVQLKGKGYGVFFFNGDTLEFLGADTGVEAENYQSVDLFEYGGKIHLLGFYPAPGFPKILLKKFL